MSKVIYVIQVYRFWDDNSIDSRNIGWQEDKDTAIDSLVTNSGVIADSVGNAAYYPYALVEEVPNGIYPDCLEHRVWFFEWDREKVRYVPSTRPKDWEGVVGFTMG